MAAARPATPPGAAPGPDALRALVLAPSGRDAALVSRMLVGDDLRVSPVADVAALVEALGHDDVGIVILTQEAVELRDIAAVADVLDAAPDWSEVPIVVFVDPVWGTAEYLRLKDVLGPHRNVTVLDRPVRTVAFQSVVEMAVRGRRQQLRVRDLLGRVNAFNARLQERVDAQTATLQARADAIEDLARALVEVENRERERIAQLLHDDLQQLLYGIKIHFGLLRATAGADAPDYDRIGGYIDEALTQTRLLTVEVHPGEAEGGARGALERVATLARERYGLEVHLCVGEVAVPPTVAPLLTRVARELLLNVVKHAGTGEAWVDLQPTRAGCRLVVRDEGRGLPSTAQPEPTGRGLADLRHRLVLLGGTVTMASAPEGGTVVTVDMPRVGSARARR